MSEPQGGISKVNLNFQLTREEFVLGCRRGYLRSPWFYIVVPLTTLGVALLAVHMHSEGGVAWIVPAVLAVGWWPFFYFVLPGVTFGSKPATGQPRSTTFSGTGSHHQGLTYTFERPWSAYRGCIKYPDMYVLRYKMGNSTTIPRKAFVSPAEEEAFRAMVGLHMRVTDLST